MSRIKLTEEGELLRGKLNGSILQTSVFGTQLRKWSETRNPQTMLQQVRRGSFLFLQSRYRNLTTSQKDSWSINDGSPTISIRRHCGNNINRQSIEHTSIKTYVSLADPTPFPLQVIAFDHTQLIIGVSSGSATVPAGTTLYLSASEPRKPTQVFYPAGMIVPFLTFPAGYTFNNSNDFITDYTALYQWFFTPAGIGIRTVLVRTANGRAGETVQTVFPIPS